MTSSNRHGSLQRRGRTRGGGIRRCIPGLGILSRLGRQGPARRGSGCFGCSHRTSCSAARLRPTGLGDEFNSLSLDVNGTGAGRWVPRMRAWGTPVASAHHDKCLKEHSGYAPPGGTPLNLNLHRVGNGVLTLYGRRIPDKRRAAFFGPNPDPGYEAMCGTLDGSLSHSQTYGDWEVRLRQVNVSLGHHIAIWLTPTNGDWPPELDLFETIGANPAVPFSSADKFHFVGHYPTPTGFPSSISATSTWAPRPPPRGTPSGWSGHRRPSAGSSMAKWSSRWRRPVSAPRPCRSWSPPRRRATGPD